MSQAGTLERVAIHDVMHRYALAIDTKDWGLLESVFCPEVTADFRSFGSKAVFTGSRNGWIAQVRATIEGMDATQHQMTNHLYTVDGERAQGTTYIRALHVCRNDWGGDRYTAGGHYHVGLLRAHGEWRVREYRLEVTFHEGDRHVLRAAARRAARAGAG